MEQWGTVPEWKYAQMSYRKGSTCDKELADLKKAVGLKADAAILRLALHSYWKWEVEKEKRDVK